MKGGQGAAEGEEEEVPRAKIYYDARGAAGRGVGTRGAGEGEGKRITIESKLAKGREAREGEAGHERGW